MTKFLFTAATRRERIAARSTANAMCAVTVSGRDVVESRMSRVAGRVCFTSLEMGSLREAHGFARGSWARNDRMIAGTTLAVLGRLELKDAVTLPNRFCDIEKTPVFSRSQTACTARFYLKNISAISAS